MSSVEYILRYAVLFLKSATMCAYCVSVRGRARPTAQHIYIAHNRQFHFVGQTKSIDCCRLLFTKQVLNVTGEGPISVLQQYYSDNNCSTDFEIEIYPWRIQWEFIFLQARPQCIIFFLHRPL